MPQLETFELIEMGIAASLLLILIISFRSRARVFCQYLRYMTGINLTPRDVKKVFSQRGKAGVRELFLDLLIREDLEDTPPITPETPRSKPAAALIER
ncbi:MAG: hypothetical protein AAF657_07195 [Acidobacteriota bacterium]